MDLGSTIPGAEGITYTGSRPARPARCASRRRQPFDGYDAPGRPPVQARGDGRGRGRPACRPAPLTTRPWTSGPTAPPEVGAGREPRGGIRTDDNGYGQPGRKSRRSPHTPGSRRTYAFRVGHPRQGARGAPSPTTDRPRAGLSVATAGRRSAGGPPVDDTGRGGPSRCGILTSTTRAVRVDAAPAVRRVRRPGC